MNLSDSRQEFLNASARAASMDALNDLQSIFRRFSSEINELESEKTIDPDEARYCRRVLALRGLEIQQRVIPCLDRLSREILQAAGRESVRSACEPRRMTEDNGNGKQVVVRELPSEFVVPPEFA